MDVLSFNYRLAPEHPAPAALEDTLNVWNHLMHLGYNAKNITVCGDSAGGNLALALGLKLKEEEQPLPRSFVLFSPWTDLTLTSSSNTKNAKPDPILTMEYLKSARKAYDPKGIFEETVYKNPYVSPLFGDYKDFSPVYIQVGSNEILLDDSTNLYEKLSKQHVPVKIDIYEGMWHVFQMCNMKIANFGVGLPHSSSALRGAGYGVSLADAQPGDIICYSGHVGIYVGNNTIVHASTAATGIKYTSPANYKDVLAVRRIF